MKIVLMGIGEYGLLVVIVDVVELVVLEFDFSVKKVLKYEGSVGCELL